MSMFMAPDAVDRGGPPISPTALAVPKNKIPDDCYHQTLAALLALDGPSVSFAEMPHGVFWRTKMAPSCGEGTDCKLVPWSEPANPRPETVTIFDVVYNEIAQNGYGMHHQEGTGAFQGFSLDYVEPGEDILLTARLTLASILRSEYLNSVQRVKVLNVLAENGLEIEGTEFLDTVQPEHIVATHASAGVLELLKHNCHVPYQLCRRIEEHSIVLSALAFDGNTERLSVPSLMEVTLQWLEKEKSARELDQRARECGPPLPVQAQLGPSGRPIAVEMDWALYAEECAAAAQDPGDFFSAEQTAAGKEKLELLTGFLSDLRLLEATMESFANGLSEANSAKGIIAMARVLVAAPKLLRDVSDYLETQAMRWGLGLEGVAAAAEFTDSDSSWKIAPALKTHADALENGGYWEDLYDRGHVLKRVIKPLNIFIAVATAHIEKPEI